MPNIFLAGSLFFLCCPFSYHWQRILLKSLCIDFRMLRFFIKVESLFFFVCIFLCFFLVLFLQNLGLATAVLIAQLFQRTDQSYSSFLLGVSLILLWPLMNGITLQERI